MKHTVFVWNDPKGACFALFASYNLLDGSLSDVFLLYPACFSPRVSLPQNPQSSADIMELNIMDGTIIIAATKLMEAKVLFNS